MKLGQNICPNEISHKFKNGSCWTKTRSLVQISEKPCVHLIGHIFSPVMMKPGQNDFFDETSDNFENVSPQVEN